MDREFSRRPVLGAIAGAIVAALVDPRIAFADTGSGTSTTVARQAIPRETLQRAATNYAGDYVAKWIDSTGKRGSGKGTLAIDPNARRAQGTMTLNGKILGRTSLTGQKFSADLSQYGYDDQTFTIPKTAWGAVEYERLGFGQAKFTMRALPGVKAGSTVEILGRFTTPGFLSFSYTITPSSGSAVRGAVNFGRRGTTVPDPVVPNVSAASQAAILSGAYACGLLTKAQASAAFGEPSKTLEPNGGRLLYQPGIDTSNCRAETTSGQQLLQMTVFHATSPQTAATYFALNRSIATPVPGAEDRAYSFSNGGTVWVLTGVDVVQLGVIDRRASTLAPALAEFTKFFISRSS